jgi:hypothetical protein
MEGLLFFLEIPYIVEGLSITWLLYSAILLDFLQAQKPTTTDWKLKANREIAG